MGFKQLMCGLLLAAVGAGNADATKLTLKMDATSPTMTMIDKDGGKPVQTGEPASRVYQFQIDKGVYILTAYGKDGKTVSGTIELKISGDSIEQQLSVLTNTFAVTNKNDDNTGWVFGQDYTLDAAVTSRQGERHEVTIGNSTTSGRKTCLAFNGNSIRVKFSPSDAHRKEGYTDVTQVRTLTAGTTMSVKIPMGGHYTIPVPAGAGLELGVKYVHFTDFTRLEPVEVKKDGDRMLYTYFLAQGQVYNYRTWMKGKLTQAGYFTYPSDPSRMPEVSFTKADYEACDPRKINHSPRSNDAFETGDIFVNADCRGMVSLGVGESFVAHAMRTWELTDNQTNNYFIEPDFHYTVLDLNGNPCSDVIDVVPNSETSPWATITGKRKGTVIVLVTYDAISLNYYSGKEKKPYMGGADWGAVWPENTGTYIVTVGETDAKVRPNMTINEKYNLPEGGSQLLKMSGAFVDAEHDVFYYLDGEDGARYSFKPEGVASVTVARPSITSEGATYTGFSADGVVRNEDGSYTLTLREGRQIVRLTDSEGNSTYQILRARRCKREITNETRPGSNLYQPGDRIKIQYDGLYHPANKIAGIYTMSAYVTYNNVPNGSSIILSANQYNFAGNPKAQVVEVDIPDDYDIEAHPVWVMDEGVIQVTGYGDPIGNHRYIDPVGGRSPNFAAVPHQTYFGYLPDIRIPLQPDRQFEIEIVNPSGAEVTVTCNGQQLAPGPNGLYAGTYGTYSVVARKKGYRCFRHDFVIADDAVGRQRFEINPVADRASWDGESTAEPPLVSGVYHVTLPSHLAWIAQNVNAARLTSDVKVSLDADIQLGEYDWNAIGTNDAGFAGEIDGNGHVVDGLFINQPDKQYQGLFGFVGAGGKSVHIHDLTVRGSVTAKGYAGGLAGSALNGTRIDRCAVDVAVTGSGNYVGGVVGIIAGGESMVSNSCNLGNVSGTSAAGGIAGGCSSGSTGSPAFENLFNTGIIIGGTTGGCIGSAGASSAVKVNLYSTFEGRNTDGQTTVTDSQMASGEVAWNLGAQFGQKIGVEKHPVLSGVRVYKVSYSAVVVYADFIPSVSGLSTEVAAVYTNGTLPVTIDGKLVKWYSDAAMTNEVTSVTSDATLYARIDGNSGVGSIPVDSDDNREERWFSLDGVEIEKPSAGVRGFFIRVIAGKAEKIVL